MLMLADVSIYQVPDPSTFTGLSIKIILGWSWLHRASGQAIIIFYILSDLVLKAHPQVTSNSPVNTIPIPSMMYMDSIHVLNIVIQFYRQVMPNTRCQTWLTDASITCIQSSKSYNKSKRVYLYLTDDARLQQNEKLFFLIYIWLVCEGGWESYTCAH